MSAYLSKFSEVTGAGRALQTTKQVVGGDLSPFTAIAYRRDDIRGSSWTALGGAALGGWYGLRRGHGVLGAIGGGSLGRNLPALFDPGERRFAVCNLAQTAAGVAGALAFHKSWKTKLAGFAVAWLAAGAVIYAGGWRK